MLSVTEPKAAITVSNTSSVKVIRHDINDSVQTKSSSGVVRVVQSASAGANKSAEGLDETLVNPDGDENFHNAESFSFTSSNKFDDDPFCRFSTNFVTPPLRQEQVLTAIPSQVQDLQSTLVKKKTTGSHMEGKSKHQTDSNRPSHPVVPSVSDVTSTSTHSSDSLTELTDLMQSAFRNELGQASVTDASKQEKQKKKKKPKKG